MWSRLDLAARRRNSSDWGLADISGRLAHLVEGRSLASESLLIEPVWYRGPGNLVCLTFAAIVV